MRIRTKIFIKSLLSGLVPYKLRFSSRFRNKLRFLLESRYWDETKIEKYQEIKLRQLLLDAYQHNDYYEGIFKRNGITLADIENSTNLRDEILYSLDVVTKSDVRNNLHRMTNKPFSNRKYLLRITSGSTGEPLRYYNSSECLSWGKAFYTRHMINNDYTFGDKAIYLRSYVPKRNTDPHFYYDPFWRIYWFSAYHMTDENLLRYVNEMRKSAITTLVGYPSSLSLIAAFCNERSIQLPMKTVITASEALLPYQREMIQTAFSCRVGELYGLSEHVVAFGKCKHSDGYHDFPEYGVFELIDSEGNRVTEAGKMGEIVGTNFTNMDCMPWIRYKTGDYATLSNFAECTCGLSSKIVINDIIGRTDDLLYSPNGYKIPGVNIYTVFRKYAEFIRQFQVHQEELDRVVVSIVPTVFYRQDIDRPLREDLEQRLGSKMQVDIIRKDKLPRGPAGKFRVISRAKNLEFRAKA